MQKPDTLSTVNCNLKSMDPWKKFIFTCTTKFSDCLFERKNGKEKYLSLIKEKYQRATLKGFHYGTAHRLGNILLYPHNSQAKLQDLDVLHWKDF